MCTNIYRDRERDRDRDIYRCSLLIISKLEMTQMSTKFQEFLLKIITRKDVENIL